MNQILRVVVTGPVGAGKSTFIKTISEIDVVDTDRKATDDVAEMKSGTTVAMDFGRLTLGDGMWLHLYGTPGQSRFSFMWDMLIRRAHGFVLLAPAHLPGHLRAARTIKAFMQQRTQCPMVVGITHADHPDAWAIEDIQLALGDASPSCPYVILNAGDPSGVAETLLVLVENMMDPSQSIVAS